MAPWILAILAIALIATLAIAAQRAEQQRRERLADLAQRLDFSFRPASDRDHDDEYAHFELFRQGHSRRAYNTLLGSIEISGRSCRVKCGDFSYEVTTGSGKDRSTTTYHLSYLILHLPWRTPDLLIRREHLFDKLAGALGFDDIDFESEEFSRRFHVKGADKRFAYDVVHARAMEFLLAAEACVIDIEHGRLCLTTGTERWEPGEFETRLALARDFLALWPPHVTRALAEDRA